MAAILPKNDPSQTVRSAVFFHQRILVTGDIIFSHFYFPLSDSLYALGERCDSAFVAIVQTSDGKMSRIVELNCRTMKTETLSEVSFIDFYSIVRVKSALQPCLHFIHLNQIA